MKCIADLKVLSDQYRIYRSSSILEDVVKQTIRDFTQRAQADHWADCFRRLDKEPSDDGFIHYATKPIVLWGGVDTSIFRRRWGVRIPDWMEEFYSQVTSLLLPMLNPIYIPPPDRAVYDEEVLRIVQQCETLPIQVIQFANVADRAVGFAMRQRLTSTAERWDVIPVSDEFARTEYQSSEWDDYEGDATVDEWLLRMLKTDCHPLMLGYEELESMPYSRVQ